MKRVSGPEGVRPRRGSPDETRARLVAAAAEVFEREGYAGTDSNRLARAAGYAPGTFYKHFTDKRSLFLVVYEEWVTKEWHEVAAVAGSGPEETRAERIVDRVLEHHRRWKGVRASLRALVATDDAVRSFYRAQRRRQLAWLGDRASDRERHALALFTLERAADGLADGEAAALGLSTTKVRAQLVDLVRRELLAPAKAARP